MDLFTSGWWQELAIQVLIALLTTLLGMLAYDRKVAEPRARRMEASIRARLDRPF